MRIPSRRAVLTLACLAAVAVPAFGSSAAHADRCEPTEPVVRILYPGYEEPMSEADSPFCYAMLNYVYPRLCDDPRTLFPTATTPGCIRSINPDPNEPVVVAPFAPDPMRIACRNANFVVYVAGGSPVC